MQITCDSPHITSTTYSLIKLLYNAGLSKVNTPFPSPNYPNSPFPHMNNYPCSSIAADIVAPADIFLMRFNIGINSIYLLID